MSAPAPSVVIYVNGGSCPEPAPKAAEVSCGQSSDVASGGGLALFPSAAHSALMARGRLDPWRIAQAFPERWSAFVRANFRAPVEAARHFAISERAARKWWAGEGGRAGSTGRRWWWRWRWKPFPARCARCSAARSLTRTDEEGRHG